MKANTKVLDTRPVLAPEHRSLPSCRICEARYMVVGVTVDGARVDLDGAGNEMDAAFLAKRFGKHLEGYAEIRVEYRRR